MTDLTPRAEALKSALIKGHVSVFRTSQKRNEAIAGIARTIVEYSGITGECSCELSEGQCAHATRRELAAFTLLELAGGSP